MSDFADTHRTFWNTAAEWVSRRGLWSRTHQAIIPGSGEPGYRAVAERVAGTDIPALADRAGGRHEYDRGIFIASATGLP